MNILVTGGAGFLGKPLCRALRTHGHTVKVLDKKENTEFPTVIGDILDEAKVATALEGIDVVFHLASFIEAGESVQKPYEYTQNNVLGTVILLETMRKQGIKTMIFSSSAAVYGEPLQVPIKEDDRTMPINPYGMTKLAMEALASSYSYAYGFTCVALRYFNLYGPGEDHEPETHAIPRFIQQIREGTQVTVWGNGEHQRDFVYVDDIVDAHIKALELEKGKYHYMNLSGKNATRVKDVIQLLETYIGKKANIQQFPPRPGDPLLLFADGSKAKEELGWESTTTLEDGLKKTVEWFIANKSV
ncbi:UDP-glucose 4-epimerase GalE [Candidatus Cerribacteria bacterium 'Amazon FNV 2010 28 9']|uniref:UDP-glucose 4-epimerase GalE n=1 Tax=Candidatus Cerribacteria bacterium 'Amazon FNV 2010 28 9' TaxID=2081795 RepID=A0A317JNV8_9BACT|nr:MAG: UDP-glucose 4-epimerase GalE [Candidatus Cerribacteria bacterium 'Amazon FNV 2010 28 9']